MAKIPTFPILYNEVKQIDISKLKKWGYLNPNQEKNGALQWSRNGTSTGNISIRSNTKDEKKYIELDYKVNDKPRKYKVYLTSTKSNLNKGEIWYFVCPETKKRCRILYSVNGYFLHRDAFSGCMYECQTQSKYQRVLASTYGNYFKLDDLYEQLYSKYFKKTYRGRPTKRYLKIMTQIERAESITRHDIERALLF